MRTLEFKALDEPALVGLGQRLAKHLDVPLVCFLSGDLGAGKTTFCRSVIRALGVQGAVKSPTYNLLEEYEADMKILHIDLYRLQDPEELDYIGIRDYIDKQALWLVEWPDKGQGAIPEADLVIQLSHQGNRRSVRLDFLSSKSFSLCQSMG